MKPFNREICGTLIGGTSAIGCNHYPPRLAVSGPIIGASGDAAYRPTPPVYQVCPHCKRLLHGISSSGSKGFCDEHGEVTPMNSAVVNTHSYRQTVDWSAA